MSEHIISNGFIQRILYSEKSFSPVAGISALLPIPLSGTENLEHRIGESGFPVFVLFHEIVFTTVLRFVGKANSVIENCFVGTEWILVAVGFAVAVALTVGLTVDFAPRVKDNASQWIGTSKRIEMCKILFCQGFDERFFILVRYELHLFDIGFHVDNDFVSDVVRGCIIDGVWSRRFIPRRQIVNGKRVVVLGSFIHCCWFNSGSDDDEDDGK